MATSRLCTRSLSAFKPANRLWVPVSSRPALGQATTRPAQPSHFSLISQNLDAFSSRPIARARILLGDILEQSTRPDVIFLQEVTSDVHNDILANPKVREAFLVTDAEDKTSFHDVPFATMTLLSRKRFAFDLGPQQGRDEAEGADKLVLGPVSRVELPSKYGRCALSADVISPSIPTAALRLINVHLDSLGHTFQYRSQQLEILANLLREPGCRGGLIAGDFNAISPDDHTLLDENGLVDAWVALHGEGGPDGATWGVGAERNDGLKAGRLDKVAMLGVKAEEMEILCPRHIEVPRPGEPPEHIPCSDHHGLRLSFTV